LPNERKDYSIMFWRNDMNSQLSKKKSDGKQELRLHLASPLARPLSLSTLEACGVNQQLKNLQELQEVQKQVKAVKDKNRNLNTQRKER